MQCEVLPVLRIRPEKATTKAREAEQQRLVKQFEKEAPHHLVGVSQSKFALRRRCHTT